MQRINLFGFPTSPYTLKVACYLEYKQLSYEFTPVSPITFDEVRFTHLRQVPILSVDGNWRSDSNEIGIWLDQLFPHSPMLDGGSLSQSDILVINEWIDRELIPTMFRNIVEWKTTLCGLKNGWALGRIMNHSTPLPLLVKLAWPLLLRRAKFIQTIVKNAQPSGNLIQVHDKLVSQFVDTLGDGPFLGGNSRPSIADLSAFPVVTFGYMTGLSGDTNWFANDQIVDWVRKMMLVIPKHHLLIPKKYVVREIPI